jgi:hypothetical protein
MKTESVEASMKNSLIKAEKIRFGNDRFIPLLKTSVDC